MIDLKGSKVHTQIILFRKSGAIAGAESFWAVIFRNDDLISGTRSIPYWIKKTNEIESELKKVEKEIEAARNLSVGFWDSIDALAGIGCVGGVVGLLVGIQGCWDRHQGRPLQEDATDYFATGKLVLIFAVAASVLAYVVLKQIGAMRKVSVVGSLVRKRQQLEEHRVKLRETGTLK